MEPQIGSILKQLLHQLYHQKLQVYIDINVLISTIFISDHDQTQLLSSSQSEGKLSSSVKKMVIMLTFCYCRS